MTLEFTALPSQTVNNDSLSYSLLLTHDLNGDGNLDLVASYSGSRPLDLLVAPSRGLAIFYGTGNGQFTAGQQFEVQAIGLNPFYKFEQQQYAAYQTVLQNHQNIVNSLPAGVTPPPFIYPNPPSPPSPTKIGSVEIRSQAVGDVDRDGRPDLITMGTPYFSYPGKNIVVSVLKGTGSGFSAAINSPVTSLGVAPGGLAVADFNGDGNLDVAAISAGNVGLDSTEKQRVSILFGDGTGQFSNEKEISLGFDTSAVVAADFNGDGQPDLAVGGNAGGGGYSNPTVSVLLSTGAGNFSSPKQILVEVSGGSSSFPLLADDFNSDGKIDLGNGSWYLAGDGTGEFAKAYEFTYGGASATVTGDFNRDGKLDIVDGGSVLLGNGSGRYSYPERLPPGVFGVVSGDFDRDGKPDLAQISQNGTITAFLNRTTRSDLLVLNEPAIDASIESGGLILDLNKGTLQIGGISQPLTGTYNTVRGTEQADRITGSRLKESLEGLGGNDTLIGGDGSDTLSGGLGNDRLTGGKGKDKFILNNGETFFFTQSIPFSRAMGVDQITDFETGKDKIELYRNTFTVFTGGRRFSFASVETKKAAQTSRALITYVPKTGSLFYNQNGARSGFGLGGQIADFTNGLELRAKDFEVT